jgi:hypothetical protein
MTDEEFERLKEAEKDHLRAKKRLRAALEALKRRSRTQGIVEQMKRGAGRLLAETESLVDALRRAVAQREARLETALDTEEADLEEAEAALRDERAETLLRQYKTAQSTGRRRPDGADDDRADDDRAAPDGPEKTIGRMQPPRPDDDT